MADFESWERRNLVAFAQEAERRLAQLARLQELEEHLQALRDEVNSIQQDRRMLLEHWREACRKNEELLLRNATVEERESPR